MNWGGWLTGLSEDILKQDDIELGICFPLGREKHMISGTVNGLAYYGFPWKSPYRYDPAGEAYLKEIIDDFQPDVVHIFGTELPHSLAITNAYRRPERTVIHIQGLSSFIAIHCYAGLSDPILRRHTFRDFIRRDSIRQQKKKFEKRGIFEIQAFQNAGHVTGRTTWDKACTFQMNPNLVYHYCSETLRSSFYQHKWKLGECERHSVFVSHGSLPIKGLHFMLAAMPEIIKNYPDTKLYVAGPNVVKTATWKDRLKKRSYWVYLRRMIAKLNLENSVFFTGELNEQQICKRFLKSNVYVCCSSIENSPNSLGEAMLLGLPCVASDVGGVSDMLINRSEGYVYPYDEPYMLAFYICEIFKNDNLALKFSQNARKHAMETHDRAKNTETVMEIYREISEQPAEKFARAARGENKL